MMAANIEELEPFDAGIFNRKDSQIEKCKIVAACANVEIIQTKNK
jgi:hypothetical protein